MQAISLLCAAALSVAAIPPALAGNDVAGYESAFADYTSRHEVQMMQWRDANASVSGGGHAGHGGMDAALPAIPDAPMPEHAGHVMPQGEHQH